MSTLVDGLRSIYNAVAEDTIARLESDNAALRASWDELQRDYLRLTDEHDRLRQALTEIRTYALSPSLDPDVSASDRHIAGMVDAALAPLPSAGQEGG